MGAEGGLTAVSSEFGPKDLSAAQERLEALVAALEEPQYVEILSILENPA